MLSFESILGYFVMLTDCVLKLWNFYLSEYSIFMLSRAGFPPLVHFSGHFPPQFHPRPLSQSAVQMYSLGRL